MCRGRPGVPIRRGVPNGYRRGERNYVQNRDEGVTAEVQHARYPLRSRYQCNGTNHPNGNRRRTLNGGTPICQREEKESECRDRIAVDGAPRSIVVRDEPCQRQKDD